MLRITKNSKIFLAGHNGMVGSAIFRKLKLKGYKKILLKNKNKLNLLDQKKTQNYLKRTKPDLVIIAAARVGGINANLNFKDKFLYENLQIQNNLIHGSYLAGVKNLFFLGSSCIYPSKCKQPMKEKYLLTGPFESTNEGYAIAKVSGIKMCEYYNKNKNLNYKSFIPPNMYGPNDNYDLNTSHFFPALLRKIYQCKKKKKKILKIWGTGKPKREVMYVEDFAESLIYFFNISIKEPFINIGTGREYSINFFANFLMKKFNIKLKIQYEKSKPDGMKNKCLDINLAKKYLWKPPKNGLNKSFVDLLKDFEKRIKL
tara:strand:+ start:3830 stop:4774 length:945 start_codon:yes stop_codon:yes gene_type:complete